VLWFSAAFLATAAAVHLLVVSRGGS
jgi:hypothetical protein